MSEPGRFPLRPAFEIPPGHAVLVGAGPGVLGLKGQRRAKKYVQDYVVALAPAPEGGHRLDFVDPETELADCGAPLRFVPGPETIGETGVRPRPGELVRTEAGLCLAVWETDGPSRFVSFIDVASGEVRRLRKDALGAIHRAWRVEAPAGGQEI